MGNTKKVLRSIVGGFKDDFKGLSLSLSERKTQEIAIKLQLGSPNGGKQGTSPNTTYSDSMIQSSESTSSVASSPISPLHIISLQPTSAKGSRAASTVTSTFSSTSQSRVVVVSSDESCAAAAEGAPSPYPPETEEGSPAVTEEGSKNFDNAEGTVIKYDDPFKRTSYQFTNCQTVFWNAFNAQGVKVQDCGNNAPQLTCIDSPSSPMLESGQSSGYQGIPADFTSQAKTENSSHPLIPPGIPVTLSGPRPNNPDLNELNMVQAVQPTDMHSPKFKEGQAPPVTIDTELPHDKPPSSKSCPSKSPLPTRSTTFSCAGHSPPSNINTANCCSGFFSQLHSHSHHHSSESPLANNNSPQDSDPRPHPVDSPTSANSPRDPPDTNSKLLEHHLESIVATLLAAQPSEISSSPEILTPRAQSLLRAVNALVSETSISSSRSLRSRHHCESPHSYLCTHRDGDPSMPYSGYG